MNNFIKVFCFIGGANIEILQKCPSEKNGFIATGIGIINVVILSLITIWNILNIVINNILLLAIISIFYGFIIFISYWGILSIIRRAVKYSIVIKIFVIISICVLSLIASFSIQRFITKNIMFDNYFYFSIIALVMLFIYYIPIALKLLINSSTYEEEKEKMERNFLIQKEADIIAYKQKYGDYAIHFNEANIKMESIKHLSELSKEYHELMEKMQKETFEYLNTIEKSNTSNNDLIINCKENVEKAFKANLEKMSKIFNSI